MRILLLSLSLRRGGAEKIALLLANGLRHLGHDARILAIRRPVEYDDLIRHYELDVNVLVDSKPYYWANVHRYVARLRKYHKQWRPHVTLVFSAQALIIATLADVGKILVGAQNTDEVQWHQLRPGHLVLNVLEYWCMRSDGLAVAACSRDAGTAFQRRFKLCALQVSIIENAIDFGSVIRRAEQQPGSCPTVLCVGTPYYQKNFAMAIQALHVMRRTGVNARLRIAGDGPDLRDLSQLANSLGLDDSVELLGRRKDIPSLMASSDFLWMTSRWEGFGLVLVEAMAAGLPVIATNVLGVRNVIEHGVTGSLVPSDDHRAMAETTIRLLHSYDDALALSRNAADRVADRYSARRMAQEYATLMASLVAAK